jgi:flagellar hook-associated protein 3 FlgL
MTIISTSAFYERTNAGLTSLRKQAEALQGQVASGQRVNKSSDDPVAASRLRDLSRADDISTANVANANRAMSDLSLADAAIQEIAANLATAKELAIQAATGTLSNSQRASIGEQISNIRGNIIALANSKDGAGHPLFGGEMSGGAAYTLDTNGIPVYSGTASAGDLSLGDGQSVTRGVTGPEVFNFTHNGNSTDLFAVLGTLASALQTGSPDPATAANGALDAMDAGLERITTTQTVLGGRMNWVDLNISRHERQAEMRELETSDVGSVDTATTITDLQELMTVLEASQASFVKLASLSLFDVIR